jgi:hypothetical protein
MPISTFRQAAIATGREQLLIARAAADGGVVSELPDKLGAIRAAAAALVGGGVPYALFGGLAVGIRSGVPRATLDVNLAIPTSTDRVWLVLHMSDAGFGLVGEFAHTLNFKHASGEPVQLAFDAQFDPMIALAEKLRVEDFELPVVTKQDLIAMKRLAAADPRRRRSKALRDQADIALLEGDVPEPNEGW